MQPKSTGSGGSSIIANSFPLVPHTRKKTQEEKYTRITKLDMALGFTSSSSASSSSTSTASASTASSSSSPSDNNAGIPSKGASYFFGFLITFIVLLAFFICCGFGTRRNMARRRALLAWGQWDSGSVIGLEGQLDSSDVPALFEPRFMKSDSDTFWLSVQPLTAQTLTISSASIHPCHDTTRPLPPPSSPGLPPIRLPSQNPHALHGLSLPAWIPATSLNLSSNNGVGNEKRNGKGVSKPTNTQNDVTVMQVAVVIEMPSRPRTEKGDEDGVQQNLVIGVACEAWDSSAHIHVAEGALS